MINEKKEILASAIVRTGAKAQNGANAALEEICRQLEMKPDALCAIMATGYGRNNIPFATDTKTEITCHARGAFFLNPAVRTIVDIGGQDSKVICLDETGAVTNFIMNDKCAAGTGRFLEMMARSLEMDMDQMSQKPGCATACISQRHRICAAPWVQLCSPWRSPSDHERTIKIIALDKR